MMSRGGDIEAQMNLSLREAAVTHKQTFSVNGENLRITIPAGIADGQMIKLKGHGEKGSNGAPDGDLYITFQIAPDPEFKREGDDLFTDVDIDLYTAVLGGTVNVRTIDGMVKLKVNPGTQNDTKVRLRGKGSLFIRKKVHSAIDCDISCGYTYSVKRKAERAVHTVEKQLMIRLQPQSGILKILKTFAQKADILYFCSRKTNWISNF